MTWFFRGEPVSSETLQGFAGFVYLITDLDNGFGYVGKKALLHRRKVHRKTGRKVRIQIVESDWRKYYGSNDTLKEQIKLRGTDRFRREILHLCKTKKQLSFYETEEQFFRQVLKKPGFYNSNIGGKYFRVDDTDVISAGSWSITYHANTEAYHPHPMGQEDD